MTASDRTEYRALDAGPDATVYWQQRAQAAEAENQRLREALKMEYDLVLDIYKENHNTGDIPRTWWRERARHMATALDGGPQ